jgi:hypothetical protein
VGTLRVRNEAQKVLWDTEIAGQISDGHWENAKPQDAWIAWSDAEVVVDPHNVGRDFEVLKEGYLLTDPDLLSVVGDRMVIAVREKAPGYLRYTWDDMVKDLRDLRRIMKTRSLPPRIAGSQQIKAERAATHTHEELRHYSDGDSIAVVPCYNGPQCTGLAPRTSSFFVVYLDRLGGPHIDHQPHPGAAPFASDWQALDYLHDVVLGAGTVMAVAGSSVFPVLTEDSDGNITRH